MDLEQPFQPLPEGGGTCAACELRLYHPRRTPLPRLKPSDLLELGRKRDFLPRTFQGPPLSLAKQPRTLVEAEIPAPSDEQKAGPLL